MTIKIASLLLSLVVSVLSFSTVHASSWGLRRVLETEGIKAVGIRAMSAVITPGFKPEVFPDVINMLPKTLVPKKKLPTNVKFLDFDHSLYAELSDKESFNVGLPEVTRENDHSIRVDLKKK